MESKLKSAYLNKERAAQIAEHEAMRFETMVSNDRFQSFTNNKSEPLAVKDGFCFLKNILL